MSQELSQRVIEVKKEFNRKVKTNSIIAEIIPKGKKWFNIEYKIIGRLHDFAENNPIYQKKKT